MNRIAGQSVFACERGQTAVLQSAEPTFGRSPQRTAPIKSKTVDPALAQTVGSSVGFPRLTIFEIDHAAPIESQPQAIRHWING